MPVARPEPPEARVIAHVDLDCFYVQVEQRRHPELRGKPTAVVQYNSWKGGALIAVGYEARKFGVKRSMRGEEARKACPDINLVQVPVAHDKADLKLYRDAGSEVCAILARMGKCERASIDEVYLDITEAATAQLIRDPPESWVSISSEALKSHVVGLTKDGDSTLEVGCWFQRKDAEPSDQLLACGAAIVAELRTAVFEETQFTCSAGVAHNKMLAKLASGMHKPAQQTIVPSSGVQSMLNDLPIKKIGKLGGKLGHSLEVELGVKKAGDLLRFSEAKLQDLFGFNTGTWLWRTARGINGDEVQGRMLPKSHCSGKTFPGPQALKDLSTVNYWLKELAASLQERLDMDTEQNNRTAHLLTLHAGCHLHRSGTDDPRKFPSQSCTLRYGKEKIAEDATRLFEKALRKLCPTLNLSPQKRGTNFSWRITGMSLTASNIVATPMGVDRITRFFGSSVQPNEISSSDLSKVSVPVSPVSSVETSMSEEDLIQGNLGLNSQGLIAATSTNNKKGTQGCNKERQFPSCNLAGDADLALNGAMDTGGSALTTAVKEALCVNNDHYMRSSLESREQENSSQPFSFPLSNENGGMDQDTCTPGFGPVNSLEAFDESLLFKEVCTSTISSEHQATLISQRAPKAKEAPELMAVSCSPVGLVEDSATTSPVVTSDSLHRSQKEAIKHGYTIIPDAHVKDDPPPSHCELGQENLSSGTGRRASELGEEVPKSSARLGRGQLMDFWKYMSSRSNLTEGTSSQKDLSGQYKLDEIDETVLAELPADIQLEFQSLLRMKRSRTAKRSIGDFFR